jgi:spermidine synthase
LELRYAPGMFVGLAFCSRPQRILIVGVGGGTLPMFLHKHFPQTAIDAVDIDPDVIQVARDYFGLQVDQQLRAHASDGRKFIEQCRDPYDIIMLDAFSNDEIPFSLATREFLQAVRRAVTPDGVVVGNVWGRYSNKLYDDMVRTYQEVFDELYILDIRGAGNQILLALPRRLHLSREDLTRRAQTLFPKGRVRFNLGDIVQDGYHYADTQSRDARVLRDGDRK